MRKKIFFIDPQSYNNLGMYDYEVLSRLKGFDIYFFGSELYNYKEIAGIKTYKIFSYSKYKSSLFKAISYVCSLIVILIRIIRLRPKLVHIQWIRIPVLDYYYYYFLKIVFKIKLVYTVHNILPHITKKNDLRDYKKFDKLCDCLIVHTEKTKNDLHNDFGIPLNRIVVAVHGPINYEFKAEDVDLIKASFIDEYDLKNKIIFSLLGRQSLYKGTDLVLEAWNHDEYLRNRQDITLLIAGELKDVVLPESLPENIVHIPRQFSDIEFAALLKLTDVLLLPYRRIEQSGLLLTAISENIPYCATDCGELITPLHIADVGWIINEPTSQGIANLISSIVDNRNNILAKQSDKEGWKKIADYYDWSKNAAETQKAYYKLVE